MHIISGTKLFVAKLCNVCPNFISQDEKIYVEIGSLFSQECISVINIVNLTNDFHSLVKASYLKFKTEEFCLFNNFLNIKTIFSYLADIDPLISYTKWRIQKPIVLGRPLFL